MECQVFLGNVFCLLESLKNLVSFFQIISPQRSCIPFEIKGVSIIVLCTDKIENPGNQNIPSECVEENDQCKVTGQKSKPKNKNFENELKRKKRLEKCKEYQKQKRARETPEDRVKRLQAMKSRYARQTKNESAENRKSRLQLQKAQNIKWRKNESTEHRQNRLQVQQANNVKQTQHETLQHKNNRLSKQQDSDARRKNLCNHSINGNDEAILDLVHKFHIAVSQGPLYICTFVVPSCGISIVFSMQIN